jgi:hypothetical protein
MRTSDRPLRDPSARRTARPAPMSDGEAMRLAVPPTSIAGRLWAGLVVLGLVSVTLAGCFNPFRPEVTTDPVTNVTSSGQPPRATSSRNVMKLFKWCWEHQNIIIYDEIFTEDFRFAFAETDSEGGRFPGHELQRIDEIESVRHLFQGGVSGEPPANSISMDFRSPLIPDADTRPGKTAPWHVKFQTDVDITIRTDGAVYRILSKAVFYTVRGDSAGSITERLGIAEQDRKRYWFIERYEEIGPAALRAPGPVETSIGGPTLARAAPLRRLEHDEALMPTGNMTWGGLKRRYLRTPS